MRAWARTRARACVCVCGDGQTLQDANEFFGEIGRSVIAKITTMLMIKHVLCTNYSEFTHRDKSSLPIVFT